MGWNPIKEAEKQAKRAVSKIVNPAIDAGKRSVNQIGDQVKSGVRSVGHEVESGVKRVAHEAEDGIRTAGREVEEGLTEKLPDLIEDAIEDAMKAAASGAVQKGLNAALDVIELISPNVLGLTFGFEAALVVQAEFTVAIAIVNPTSKLTEIRKWAANPPSGRSQIIACFKDFGPSGFGVEGKFSGNGFSAEWSGDDKYDKLDAFLAKRGL